MATNNCFVLGSSKGPGICPARFVAFGYISDREDPIINWVHSAYDELILRIRLEAEIIERWWEGYSRASFRCKRQWLISMHYEK
jgi:hypothetical protein